MNRGRIWWSTDSFALQLWYLLVQPTHQAESFMDLMKPKKKQAKSLRFEVSGYETIDVRECLPPEGGLMPRR